MDRSEIKILGLDPGYDRLGFSIINYKPIASGVYSSFYNRISIVDIGLIGTNKKASHATRLREVYNDLSALIKKYKPDIISIEKVFFGRNVNTAFSVGMVIGMVYILVPNDSRIVEIHPNTVKKFIAGNGRANKKQVKLALMKNLRVQFQAVDDVWDALGIAIAGAWSFSQNYK